MARIASCGRASALAFLLSPTMALADLTSAEVWANWRALLETGDQTVTIGAEEASGGTLTVRDIRIESTAPEATVSGQIDQILFSENGDGTVGVVVTPSRFAVDTSVSIEGGEARDTHAEFYQSGLTMTASGTPEEISYDYAVATMTFTVEEKAGAGAATPNTFDVNFINTTGTTAVRVSPDMQVYDGAMLTQRVSLQAKGNEPEVGTEFSFDVGIANVNLTTAATVPVLDDYEDADRALKAGLDVALAATYGSGDSTFSFTDATQSGQGSSSLGGGDIDFRMSDDGLVYAASGRDLGVRMSFSALPLPELTLALAESAFRLEMPLLMSEVPGDIKLLLSYRGLAVSDSIWAMVDPMANLPRDPANLVLDLSGKARWLVDVMNPEAAADISAAPGELHELTLNELELAVAGAELTGTGGFTFDNTDLVTFEGMPKPVGSVDMQLQGGNGLLDKLVAMGLIPDEDAMGFRMMLGLFARPGEGTDNLVSTIEVNEAGEVLANGQRLR